MHRKHVLLGFLLGLAVGAYYHWANKDTRKDQDSLYKLVSKVRGKVEEAADENSDLHGSIVKNAEKVKEASADVADKAKASVADAAEQVKARTSRTADKVQAGVEDAADAGAAKVQQVADSAAKHADERVEAKNV